MDIEINENISLLDQVKIQAQVLLPVIRAFREELGDDRANAIVRQALGEWSRNLFHAIGARTPGTPLDKWAAVNAASMPRIGDAIDVDFIKHDADTMEFNVTGCRYAEFFRALGEPELGGLLLCDADVYVAEVGSPDLEFRRTQTIMQGATYCDFRYHMKRGGAAE
ncbi:MAG TPA: L-2-amino-thiazoline-4-carboxylic acid hydrolase [Candidatus Margulisiibacteriota bacterium]|nr:L-2-amino-thiazoline-4-carboxylic acid hydrolase [Candidatus Margulisiibacteriota bacterium]